MSIKAKLKIILQADATVVAETEDAALWHKVLLAINNGTSEALDTDVGDTADPGRSLNSQPPREAIKKMAAELGLSAADVEGACGPTEIEPYLHLNHHCWEAMKKQTPERGPTAYSSIAIAGTLLALWFRAAGKGNPTQAQAQAVLAELNLRDQNPARGIERSEWLHSRPGGVIALNPAEISRAVGIAQSFCSKKWAATVD